MPNDNVKNTAFVPDDDIIGKKPIINPAPEKQIGINTDNDFYRTLIDAAQSNKLDISSLDSFLTTSRSRDQIYSLIDTMGEDSVIAAVLETYAEDATETNGDGNIIWAESDDPDAAKYVNYLLASMRVNKHAYGWVHSLCKYGDLYLRLYRESDYQADELFDSETVAKNKRLVEDIHLSDKDLDPNLEALDKETLTEDVKIKAYASNDHYVHYLEMVPNPAEVFELTKFGKSYAYIKTEINTPSTSFKNWYEGSNFLRYKFKKNDINIYQPTEFVHAYLEDDTNRTPEEVKIYLTDSTEEDSPSVIYKVRRGQSLLYNTFKIWRELTLLENSILLNRVTKSSLVRVVGVEVGDMPKEMIQPHLQGVKNLMEQKSSLDAGKSMNEYTNPGPIENNIYIPTRNGQGALNLQQVGGDVNVGQLTDLDYFRDRLFGSLRVPKQFFGFTEDGAGFNGGQSLTIISSRYAKMIIRIQNTLVQALTDAVNIFLIDKGLQRYVNDFAIKMVPPVTQDELDRRDNTSSKVQLTSDIMNMLSDIEDPVTKLKILKNLLSSFLTDPEVIDLIQGEIDKLESEAGAAPEEPTGEDFFGSEAVGEDEDLGLGGGADLGLDLGSELGLQATGGEGEPVPGTEAEAGEEEEALPTPTSLGLDFTNSNNPEFQ